ncbi:MAG: DUF417 family protein [Phocaeicola sp.]|nr:YkgB family protein [Phocaeicola sp.]MDD7448423.1 DUF417 family protein [Prevotellaceae bacterium]MDY3913719.1 DUF417 family protein [Phocaeicola sp.]MDY5938365.1 DUF417 family protein [Phocaeicola sp.]
MNFVKSILSGKRVSQAGYYLILLGSATILIWLGIFKFTLTEALAIKPLLEHHPLTFWVYRYFSLQTVSNFVGIIEISVGLLLLLSICFPLLKRYAGVGMVLIFLTTLSFLFFTPDMWRVKDGVIITDYFILKDIAYLGFGIMLFSHSNDKI